MDTYHEVLTTAIENGDMNLLPSLWNLTLVASARGDGAIFRERITKKIPEMATVYKIPATSSFPEFVQIWNAELLSEEIGALKAVHECVENNNLTGVKYITNKHPETQFNWRDLCIQAINNNSLELMKFFFDKVEEVKQKFLINDGLFYASKRNNVEIVRFLLTKAEFAQKEVDYVFQVAISEGSQEAVDYAIELGVSDSLFSRSAGDAILYEHPALAEHLLAKGANISQFLEGVCTVYDRDLIKKYIHNQLFPEYAKKIYSRIEERNDYDMLDFLAKERPEFLAAFIKRGRDPKLHAYARQLVS